MPLPSAIVELPVYPVLPQLQHSLNTEGLAVLQAPPGAGKTTAVPLALLEAQWMQGQALVLLEPRRLAARHAAARLAGLLGEKTGQTVGLRIRHERQESANTRILVVTEGVLTRMLQQDPELAGIAAVVFDEFHERSIHADTALALCLQSREILRDDLRLLVMSATLDTEAVAALLDDAPIIRSRGRQFPVQTHYRGDRLAVVEPRNIAKAVALKVIELVDAEPGSMLVFLPGAGEICQAAAILRDTLQHSASQTERIDVFELYGNLSPERQSQAISAAPRGSRKIVLATNIAETSLTIEGVRVVVDSGLARENRFHPATGMNRLQTVFISQDSADQRRGRAGRTEPGVCHRLWSQQRHSSMARQRTPEILQSDLSSLMLELALWGVTDVDELRWLNSPPPAAVAQARDTLKRLSAIDDQHRISDHGRQMAAAGVAPRLAHMLIRAAQYGQRQLASQLAAILSEPDLLPRGSGVDLQLRLALLQRGSSAEPRQRRVLELARQLAHRVELQTVTPDATTADTTTAGEPLSLGVLLGFAFPERVAMARGSPGSFLLASGRGARLDPADPLASESFIVVADLDGGSRESSIYRAAALPESALRHWFSAHIRREDRVHWDPQAGRVQATRRDLLASIVLDQKPLDKPAAEQLGAAIVDGIRHHGLQALHWSASQQSLIHRVNFLNRLANAGQYPAARERLAELQLPDLREHWLLDNLTDWLGPYVTTQRNLAALKSIDTDAALNALLGWHSRQQLDELTPAHITVPSGSRIAIDYTAEPLPVLAVRVQEVFGLTSQPAIVGGTVPLLVHLLSPARRPVQVTTDLAGFWRNSYSQVRKELRGRYPKHYWPEDPRDAVATSKTKKHMNR